MFLLILESLGSTELLFILIMALVFFGPRKLPQISRSLGKNIADFRRASEDFKRTWDKEVTLEEASATGVTSSVTAGENSILDAADLEPTGQPVPQPTIQAIAPDRVVPRHSPWLEAHDAADRSTSAGVEPGKQPDRESDSVTDETQPSPKRDWL